MAETAAHARSMIYGHGDGGTPIAAGEDDLAAFGPWRQAALPASPGLALADVVVGQLALEINVHVGSLLPAQKKAPGVASRRR